MSKQLIAPHYKPISRPLNDTARRSDWAEMGHGGGRVQLKKSTCVGRALHFAAFLLHGATATRTYGTTRIFKVIFPPKDARFLTAAQPSSTDTSLRTPAATTPGNGS